MIFDDENAVGGLVEATKGTRFLNYIVDTICIFVIVIGFSFVLGIFLAIFSSPENDLFENPLVDLFLNFFVFGIWGVYYIFFETVFQRTPGKFLTGTIVVSDTGETPTFGKVVGRTFSRFIPFEPIIGLFTDFLHDTLPGTRVVVKGK